MNEQNETINSSELINELAEKNFQAWNAALLTRDRKVVANLYTDDNSFLPTLSSDFKKGREGAEDYFQHFLEKNPRGEIVEEIIQMINETAYLHSGLYNFEVGPENSRKIVKARFSFLWTLNAKGEWKIAHHHSSLLPQS